MSEKLKTLIICHSSHHGNTRKVAEVIANQLDAVIVDPGQVIPARISEFDLLGFGSGIYNRKHHPSLLQLVEKLPLKGKRTFIFSTSTIILTSLHDPLRALLRQKEAEIIGEFQCKGFMNYSFTKLIPGGLNKGRPNEQDLVNARKFAEKIAAKLDQEDK